MDFCGVVRGVRRLCFCGVFCHAFMFLFCASGVYDVWIRVRGCRRYGRLFTRPEGKRRSAWRASSAQAAFSDDVRDGSARATGSLGLRGLARGSRRSTGDTRRSASAHARRAPLRPWRPRRAFASQARPSLIPRSRPRARPPNFSRVQRSHRRYVPVPRHVVVSLCGGHVPRSRGTCLPTCIPSAYMPDATARRSRRSRRCPTLPTPPDATARPARTARPP